MGRATNEPREKPGATPQSEEPPGKTRDGGCNPPARSKFLILNQKLLRELQYLEEKGRGLWEPGEARGVGRQRESCVPAARRRNGARRPFALTPGSSPPRPFAAQSPPVTRSNFAAGRGSRPRRSASAGEEEPQMHRTCRSLEKHNSSARGPARRTTRQNPWLRSIPIGQQSGRKPVMADPWARLARRDRPPQGHASGGNYRSEGQGSWIGSSGTKLLSCSMSASEHFGEALDLGRQGLVRPDGDHAIA